MMTQTVKRFVGMGVIGTQPPSDWAAAWFQTTPP